VTLCAETLAGIADPLFPALARARRATPPETARAILAGLVEPLEQPLPDVAPIAWLLPHQSEAVLRAWAILGRFGGVLVADGVGLGKTFVGLALGELERRRGGAACVIAPASLRREWQRAAEGVGSPLAFVSHTALARRLGDVPPSATLLVVDEAHAFRNAFTRRYDTLARLAAGRRVALLTATPINNSAADLASLIRLFAGADDFRDFGVADLFESLRSRDGTDAALALAALTVSRSRRLVESQFPSLRGAFPRRVLLPPVRYDLDAAFAGSLTAILESLADLDPDDAPAERGAALLSLGLLRRLESSRAAFVRSLRRHRDYLWDWSAARESGRALSRREFRAGTAVGEDARQLVLWSLLLESPCPPGLALEHAWRGAIERALALAEASAQHRDPKLEALEGLLAGPLRQHKTIVFTEYRDTALAIARRLRRHVRLLCVAGDGAWAGTERLTRREALDAFAPQARDAVANPLLAADVLVATDVAAEGMNLQDASAVVNFDLPWNPVRVMQRVGRIDRLRSPHAEVRVAHLVPGHGLHHLTGVLRVLRGKLAALPVAAAPEPDPLSALWWLDAPASLPDALERESWRRVEPFESRERWRAAAGTVVRPERTVLAAGIAHDDGPPAVGLLLALEWPGGRRVPLPFVLGPGGACRYDAAALGALAERARDARPLWASPADLATSLAAVLPEARRRLAEWSAARHGSPPRGLGRIAALRAVARLGREAARDRNVSALETLSQASAALARELPAGLDRLLLDASRRGRDSDLLAALATLRSCAPVNRPRTPPGTPRLVLVAAIVLAVRGPDDESAECPPPPAAAAS
jgi:superfamily II DNA or RNA helicase